MYCEVSKMTRAAKIASVDSKTCGFLHRVKNVDFWNLLCRNITRLRYHLSGKPVGDSSLIARYTNDSFNHDLQTLIQLGFDSSTPSTRQND